jgi:hypothetical protein
VPARTVADAQLRQPGAEGTVQDGQLEAPPRLGERGQPPLQQLGRRRAGQIVEHPAQPVDEPGEAGRRGQLVETGLAHHLLQHQPPRQRGECRRRLAAALQHPFEQVLERADHAAQHGAAAGQQIALGQLHVGAGRHHQRGRGAGIDLLGETIEQLRHLAAVGGTKQERQRHHWILRRPLPPPALRLLRTAWRYR